MLLTDEYTDDMRRHIQREVQKGLDLKKVSARRASMEVVGNDGLIRDIRAGKIPGADRLDALFRYFGMSLTLGIQSESIEPTGTPLFQAPTIEMRSFASCGLRGWGMPLDAIEDVPAPADLSDSGAFYVVAKGTSMVPEGINPGDFCLIYPNQTVQAGDAVYIVDQDGSASIKRLMGVSDDGYELLGWLPVEGGVQHSFNELRMLAGVKEISPVAAVYSGRPGHSGVIRRDLPGRHIPAEELADQDYALIDQRAVEAAAGVGSANGDEEIIGSLAFRRDWLNKIGVNPKQASLIRARGDSMHPAIPDKALLMVDHQRKAVVGKRVYAFVDVDGLTRVKRLERVGSALLLHSENKNFDTELRQGNDAEAIEVIGQVVWSATTWG